MFDFTDRIVIVTGGTGNLGVAVVRSFAGAGARVVVPDRKTGRLDDLFPDLAASADHFLAGGYDVTTPAGMDALVNAALERFGRVHVLVHTIGGYRAGQLPHETPLDTWDQMLNLNARTTFVVNRAVVPAMIRHRYGRIINVAARPALMAGANDIAYSASKSAVVRVTESMAAAYRHEGITVNAIIPGTIDTPENRAADPEGDFQHWVSPESIARVILFLASDEAGVINGALIPTTDHHGEIG